MQRGIFLYILLRMVRWMKPQEERVHVAATSKTPRKDALIYLPPPPSRLVRQSDCA